MTGLTQAPGISGIRLRDGADAVALLNLDNGDHSMMLHCIAEALTEEHLHACGKSERLGRKVGHATVREDSREELERMTAPALAEAADGN